MLKSYISSSVVWCLVLASIDTSLRSRGEHIVPPPLNAVLMVAWASWQVMLCLLMNGFLWVLHTHVMWVQEPSNPDSGHASMEASLCLYANFKP